MIVMFNAPSSPQTSGSGAADAQGVTMIAASTPLCGVRRTWGHGMGKRIAVLGTGANGAAIGADLAMAGLDIVLIDQWPENVTAMRERGVRVEMPEQTLTVPVRAFNLCDVCTFREPFDIVLMLVKAYDSRWAGDRLSLFEGAAPAGEQDVSRIPSTLLLHCRRLGLGLLCREHGRAGDVEFGAVRAAR